MGKVYHMSKNVGLAVLLLAFCALATIIALSVAYNNERARSRGRPAPRGANPTAVDPSAADPTATPTPPMTTPITPEQAWDRYRLPDTLLPISYSLTLHPHLEPNDEGLYVFEGSAAVIFKCVRETDLIILHANKLNLTEPMSLTLSTSGSLLGIENHWFVEKTEYLVLQLESRLKAGETYKLVFEQFVGELSDDMQGLYRSEYVQDGEKRVIAASQMQATYARKTFPCFDEPALKAIFNVTIIHKNTTALSNSMIYNVSPIMIDGILFNMTMFEPTPRMSTYLLAFIVSDFEYTGSNLDDGKLIRIWARKRAIEDGQGEYALNVTGDILQFYERYYNATYPLEKSDQVAVPDFHAGAMENWGLITYRETALLYDPIVSSTGNKERITTIIAHELAHMWFGNLVTVRWWNDLWLNEGFASYVEYLGADYAEPTWDMKDQIVSKDIMHVFKNDALASSHPLSQPEEKINTPAEISQLFNTITYSKGAAVVRMLSEFLSEPVFAKGLRSYLNTFAFNNTVYTDLWDHLQEVVNSTPGLTLPHTIHDIMNRWTLQMGFPVVTIDTSTGTVSQNHFLLDPQSVVDRPSQFNYTWYIPIKWMKQGVDHQQYWLLQKEDVNREMMSQEEWVLANTKMSGYFRVNYDEKNWKRLVDALGVDHLSIPVLNRAQIIDDAFNLARAQLIPTILALSTTTYLHDEKDYLPWDAALTNLRYYTLMLDRTEVYGPLQVYLKMQVLPLFNHFKTLTKEWTQLPPGHTDQYTQINAVATACRVGLEECQELVKAMYKAWMMNPEQNPIPTNLKSTVYCYAIALGGQKEWDFAWSMFKNATLPSEASRLKSAMCCTKVPWLLNRYLDYTLDSTKIRKQDVTSTIYSIAQNIVGMPLAWNFVRAKWEQLYKQYGQGQFSVSNLITGVTTRFSTEFELQELKRFKDDNQHVGFGAASVALEQAIEKTTANMKWVAQNKELLLDWFTNATRVN